MQTKSTLLELIEARKSRLANHRAIISPEMEACCAIKMEQLRQMAIKGSHSYFRIDLSRKKFSHVYSTYHPHLKHPSIHVADPDNLFKLNGIEHPNTHYFNLETDILFYDLMMAQPFEQRKNMVSVQIRCIKTAADKYEVCLIRTFVEDCDVVGTPCSLTVKVKRMKLFSTEDFHPYRQFYLSNEKDPNDYTLLESDNKHELKGKELEVLQLGVDGLTIEEMARELKLSVTTIKSHRKQAMRKLNASSFSLACMMAVKLKIVKQLTVDS
jgi:DNA-binding CsgD family transcriptional regulator